MKQLITILVVMAALEAAAQTKAPNVRFDNPPTVYTPKGYSHAALINLGNCTMIIVAGQIALDKSGQLVGQNDLAKQTEQVFENIRNILKAEGAGMEHIVKLGYFVLDASQVQVIRDVRDRYIDTKSPPPSTLVQVSRLFRDDLLIEIEATAIVPAK
jgi:2-iminobutanoate/2-iminopropanoate deaminase